VPFRDRALRFALNQPNKCAIFMTSFSEETPLGYLDLVLGLVKYYSQAAKPLYKETQTSDL
jgi:hypothetical protein